VFEAEPDHGVYTVFVKLGDTHIEVSSFACPNHIGNVAQWLWRRQQTKSQSFKSWTSQLADS